MLPKTISRMPITVGHAGRLAATMGPASVGGVSEGVLWSWNHCITSLSIAAPDLAEQTFRNH